MTFKAITFALALLATPAMALGPQPKDPFSTGDSLGPRGGDPTIDLPGTHVTKPTVSKSGNKCRDDFQAPAIWMECSPEFAVPAPGYRHPKW